MKRVSATIEIEASPERVWRLITEFHRWPEWGPTVRAVRSESDSVAPGVTGSVQTPIGIWIPFEITSVIDGRAWSWKVGGVRATGHEVVGIGDGRSRVEFTVPVMFRPYVGVLHAGLRRIKELAETPERPPR